MQYFDKYILYIFLPIISGLTFFALAGFVKYIGPIRQFAAGKQTYTRAFIGFIAFGLYLITRPVQILVGPHPMPLIINNIREFFMIGVFSPSVFLAIYGLAFGGENIKKWMYWVLYSFCIIIAVIFVIVNINAIGGSEEIFRIGNYIAYDGLWFKNLTPYRRNLMSILFACRLISPVIILAIGATAALGRALTYPEIRKKIYNNMPKKIILSSIGTYCFSFSMLAVGLLYIYGDIPNQWWGYYIGALLAGIFETWSISLPLRKE
jgi:two-component system response regulator YesN